LLEEDDPRAGHAAAILLQSHQEALRTTGWLDRADAGRVPEHGGPGASKTAAHG
jgi:hypothetical protein